MANPQNTRNPSSQSFRFWAQCLIVLALLGGTALAQGVSIAAYSADPPAIAAALPEAPTPHKFWDNENRALFATVAALSAADFAVTRANLQSGGTELNPMTRLFSGSTALLAVNFAGETAGTIGLSYYFHKTGHHRLERIAPMFDIGLSSFAVAYDLSHR